jgi:serine/threonine protein kinase
MNSLGEGHFGKVYKCKNKKSGEIYAVKIINKIILKPNDLALIKQEKIILNLIKHENIISLKDFFEDKQNIYFITVFYEGGDLLSYMEEKQKSGEEISEKNSARIIRKIAQGISYLNFFGIIHRDLKTENIMFEKPCNFKTLKLIDLGVCKILSYGEKAKEAIGTNGYIAPEIYLNNEYSYKVDIWSLGVILYLLTTGGILPFDDLDLDTKNLAKKVCYLQQDYPVEYFGNKSKRLINLLDKMLEKNENKRININNLMKNCWFDIIKK